MMSSEELAQVDVHDLLAKVEAGVAAAREALAEEHEGDLREAVLVMWNDVTTLGELVQSW